MGYARAVLHLGVLRILAIVLPVAIVACTLDGAYAEQRPSRQLSVRAYVLPKMTCSLGDSYVDIKANISWTALGIAPSGELVELDGAGAGRVIFPEGTREITIMYQ